jgi:hypothetical protein
MQHPLSSIKYSQNNDDDDDDEQIRHISTGTPGNNAKQ